MSERPPISNVDLCATALLRDGRGAGDPVPNTETLAAMAEFESGKRKQFDTLDALMNGLHAED
jgi:hypothetical protein